LRPSLQIILLFQQLKPTIRNDTAASPLYGTNRLKIDSKYSLWTSFKTHFRLRREITYNGKIEKGEESYLLFSGKVYIT